MKSLPLGIRNNNPGNIVRTADRWIGMSADQSAHPRFAVFDTPEHGLRATMRLLINYVERDGLRTIREILNKWAPPVGTDHRGQSYTQNTSGYVQHVSRLTGFDPDEELDLLSPDTCLLLARAIVRHENGDPRPYGRPEFWYDDDTYSKALALSGFELGAPSPARSRTVGGVVVTAAGVLLNELYENIGTVTQEAVSAVGPLSSLFGPDFIRTAILAIIFAGLGAILYARLSDGKKRVV